jgi:hypothetical protein
MDNVTRGRRPHFQHIEEFASSFSEKAQKIVLGQSKDLEDSGQLRKLCYDDRYRWIREQQDAEDVFTNQGFYLLA